MAEFLRILSSVERRGVVVPTPPAGDLKQQPPHVFGPMRPQSVPAQLRPPHDLNCQHRTFAWKGRRTGGRDRWQRQVASLLCDWRTMTSSGAETELFGLTLMHVHQGQRIFQGVIMGIISYVHQVRLEEVHQGDRNSSSQGIMTKNVSG
jgi:hypothetical protein